MKYLYLSPTGVDVFDKWLRPLWLTAVQRQRRAVARHKGIIYLSPGVYVLSKPWRVKRGTKFVVLEQEVTP